MVGLLARSLGYAGNLTRIAQKARCLFFQETTCTVVCPLHFEELVTRACQHLAAGMAQGQGGYLASAGMPVNFFISCYWRTATTATGTAGTSGTGLTLFFQYLSQQRHATQGMSERFLHRIWRQCQNAVNRATRHKRGNAQVLKEVVQERGGCHRT